MFLKYQIQVPHSMLSCNKNKNKQEIKVTHHACIMKNFPTHSKYCSKSSVFNNVKNGILKIKPGVQTWRGGLFYGISATSLPSRFLPSDEAPAQKAIHGRTARKKDPSLSKKLLKITY